ncbi:MAG: LbtU family siderophore porin [Magnetococcales bacterium]|nr:LbtU family siderophore porin [Magnetococcales bacterium]MBF0148585.1 LbtU family siderophore porin [Magnetococcales bacterium]MBF0172285.1 LbtU family siderophore porin [Magnetococcales bacterium]MBF0347314.1 LbtU family siderophore porin [Magnetococcales bacterium]MBF0629722.1 LbtU family siderophore porin [Magnetococcales bacterium]
MKKSVSHLLASTLTCGMAATAFAADPPSSEEMWKLLQDQQQEIADLKKQLGEATAARKSEAPSPPSISSSTSTSPSGLKWSDRISLSGTVEVEANWNNNHDGDFTTARQKNSDITVATAELTAEARLHSWVSSKVVLLHEEDGADKEIDVDAATITIANPEVTPAFMTAGLMTLPFGRFDTLMVSDPLTLDLGETSETAAQVGFRYSHYSGSLYLFNGEAEKTGTDSHLRGIGGNLAYDRDYDFGKVHMGSDIISALEDSNVITDSDVDETTMLRHIPGLSLHGSLGMGPWTALAEYVTAMKKFDPGEMLWNSAGARPWAVNSELGYGWDLFGYQGTVAAGYQQTGEAGGLMMPKRRLRGGVNIALFENTDLALEWAHDRDYKSSDSSSVEGGTARVGTNDKSDSATLQLAVGF